MFKDIRIPAQDNALSSRTYDNDDIYIEKVETIENNDNSNFSRHENDTKTEKVVTRSYISAEQEDPWKLEYNRDELLNIKDASNQFHAVEAESKSTCGKLIDIISPTQETVKKVYTVKEKNKSAVESKSSTLPLEGYLDIPPCSTSILVLPQSQGKKQEGSSIRDVASVISKDSEYTSSAFKATSTPESKRKNVSVQAEDIESPHVCSKCLYDRSKCANATMCQAVELTNINNSSKKYGNDKIDTSIISTGSVVEKSATNTEKYQPSKENVGEVLEWLKDEMIRLKIDMTKGQKKYEKEMQAILKEKIEKSAKSTRDEVKQLMREESLQFYSSGKGSMNNSDRSSQTIVKQNNILTSFPTVIGDLEKIEDLVSQEKYEEAVSLACTFKYPSLVVDTCKKVNLLDYLERKASLDLTITNPTYEFSRETLHNVFRCVTKKLFPKVTKKRTEQGNSIVNEVFIKSLTSRLISYLFETSSS